MHANYDTVVVGAGPVGITLASLIKALNFDAKICVLDKRTKGTRSHGLSLNEDAIDEVHKVLDKALQNIQSDLHQDYIYNLKTTFSDWSRKGFVGTNTIEKTLATIATEVAINILRGPQYTINKENFDSLWGTDLDSSNLTELQTIFKDAQIIIGADGSHSDIRKIVMADKLVNTETLNHLVELKYHTEGKTQPRSYLAASSNSAYHGHVGFETMSKNSASKTKPVTLHLVVNEEVYNALRREDTNGNTKGVFGNGWTLEELEELSKEENSISGLYKQIHAYLKDKKFCKEQIATLTLTVYRSERGIAKYKNKIVALVGDARFGLVLERGCNTGLKVAACCSLAINRFLRDATGNLNDNFHIFEEFENETNKIFFQEKRWAKLKNHGLNVVKSSVYSSHLSTAAMEDTSNSLCSIS